MWRVVSCVLVAFAVIVATADAAEPVKLDLNDLLGNLGGAQGGGRPRSSTVCPVGQAHAPTEDESYKIECNGCGPKGMQIKEPFGLYRCCNNHDLCFATCGTSQDFCEELFTSCMAKVCRSFGSGERREACQKQANGMSGMTRMFGGGFHLTSQRSDPERGKQGACDCYLPEDAEARWLTTFTDFYVQHAAMERDAAMSKAEDVLSKYKGHARGEAYFKMIKKYGNSTKELMFVWDEVRPDL